MRSTRGERYRRRLLAESRGAAVNTARKVGEMLDKYVLSRRGDQTPRTVVLWDRIFMAVAIIALVLFVIRVVIK